MARPTRVAAAAAQPANPADPAATAETGSGIERRRHPRVRVDGGEDDRRQGERRQGERRGLEDLRSNVMWTTANDRGRGRGAGRWPRLKTSQIVVLLIALGAGGIAAYLAIHLAPQTQPAKVAETPRPMARVLVANREIRAGERLSSAALAWQDWPQGALRPDYITVAASPAAITDLSASVARSQFLPGDPIRKEKLTETAGSVLPALLGGGMRGVSVVVSAQSAAGGFITPNDRVDVVLTRPPSSGDGQSVPRRSETILRNVQVVAIDSELGAAAGRNADPSRASTFSGEAIATLALNPTESEVIIAASTIGKLSLLLRSSVDRAEPGNSRDGVNQAIRLSSPFWSR